VDTSKTDIEELHNQLEAIKVEYMAKIDQSDYDSKPPTTSRIEAYKTWVAQLGIAIKDEVKIGEFEGIIKLNKDAFQRISYAVAHKGVSGHKRFHLLNNGLYGFLVQKEPAHARMIDDDTALISVKPRFYSSILIILFAILTFSFLGLSIKMFLLILMLSSIIDSLFRGASGHELTHVVQFNVLKDIKKRMLNLPSVMAFAWSLTSDVDLESSMRHVHQEPPGKEELKLIVKDVIDQAENYLEEKFSSINPEDAEFYYGRGLAYAKQGNFTQAICDYTKAIKLKPKNGFAYVNRGHVYFNQGNFSQAITDYTKAIEMNPQNVELYYSIRGIAYEKQGNFSLAITDFNKVIEINPKYAKAYNHRGNTYSKQGNFTQAISDYTKVIEISPKDANAYYFRGFANYKRGNDAQAISDCNKVIEINPQSTEVLGNAYHVRGNIYFKQGSLLQSLSDFTKAIEINPKNVVAYNNRGNVYKEQGNLPQAFDEYNKAIELNPKYAEAYYGRGSVHYSQASYPQAILDFNKAIEINSNLAEAYFTRGFTYLKIKEYDNAWADVHKAESLGYKPDKGGLEFLDELKKASGRNH
jgi:tetratricopeptide (TPR) repeat protein